MYVVLKLFFLTAVGLLAIAIAATVSRIFSYSRKGGLVLQKESLLPESSLMTKQVTGGQKYVQLTVSPNNLCKQYLSALEEYLDSLSIMMPKVNSVIFSAPLAYSR